MKVESWDWSKADQMVVSETLKRARKAANFLAGRIRQRCPVGTISRPIYKRGRYAGQAWTSRDAGRLKKSVRVVERNDQKRGFTLAQFRSIGNYGNVRVYCGHRMAWYARIVEFSKPFMRPTVEASKAEVKRILENG